VSEYVSTADAAAILGVTANRVRQLVRAGRLPCARSPSRRDNWVVLLSAVYDYRDTPLSPPDEARRRAARERKERE
jgi:hypothetical protein